MTEFCVTPQDLNVRFIGLIALLYFTESARLFTLFVK